VGLRLMLDDDRMLYSRVMTNVKMHITLLKVFQCSCLCLSGLDMLSFDDYYKR
jgi:hypothetical protein